MRVKLICPRLDEPESYCIGAFFCLWSEVKSMFFIIFSKSPEASMGHSGGEHLSHSQNTLMYFWCQRTVWKSHPNSCSLRNERISEDTWCTVHQARAKNQSLSSPPLPAGGHGVGFGWRFWKLPSLTPRSPLHSFFGILASDDLIASRRWG